MKSFSSIRDSRSLKGTSAQRAANLLPLWSAPRTEEHSVIHTQFGDMSGEISDIQGSSIALSRNGTATSSDLFFKGDIYTHVIDPSFVFQYQDLRSVVNYIAPTITGYKGVTSQVLSEVKNSDSNNLFTMLPYSADDAELVYNVADLPAPISYSGGANSLSYTQIIIPYDAQVVLNVANGTGPTGVNKERLFYSGTVRLRNIKTDNEYVFQVPSNGTYKYFYPIPSGTYEIVTELLTDDTVLTIDTWGFTGFLQEYSYLYFTPVDQTILAYQVGEDASYLEFVTPPMGGFAERAANTQGYLTQRAAVLLDSTNSTHEAKDIAKPNFAPFIFALSNEQDNLIHVYDSYLDQPEDIITDNYQPVIAIYTEPYDWRIGDEIYIKSRREAIFMDERVKAMRIKVLEVATGTTSYFQRDGTVVADPADAWFLTNTSNGQWFEQRWKYTITNWGTHKFSVEALLVGTNSNARVAETIVHVPYKAPHSYFTVAMPAGRTLEQIGFFNDGNLYGVDDQDSIYKIPLNYDGFYIDYDEYIVYTLTDFDYLDLEYI